MRCFVEDVDTGRQIFYHFQILDVVLEGQVIIYRLGGGGRILGGGGDLIFRRTKGRVSRN